MKISRYLSIVILICVGFGFATADAEENLAQEVSAIFQQSCLICHGPHGPYTEQLVIQNSQALIDTGKVIPGNPDGSIFYQRLIETAVEKRMPLGQPPLAPEAVETIRQWIQAGAPDWNTFDRTDIDFITTEEMLQTIEHHVASLDPFDRAFARYFTSTHLYNAGETTETLQAYQRALSKLVNSLSWGRKVIKPHPIDSQATIFYIDLRDYEWEIGTNRWTQIEQVYPYKVEFNAPTQTALREKLTNLRQEMSCEVPFVHVDWFLATASLPPLYHDILDLPLTDSELEARLEVNVAENIINAAGKRVWRAGFNNSRVSNNNRIVERHESRYGAYWKSYDFARSTGAQNILTHPLNFTHDGGEVIFNLPNGLQAYYLVDAVGNRLDEAPISIVSNPAASDPTVRNGLSCIGCHTEGMKTFEDQVRGVVEQSENPPFDKERVLRLYVEKTVMDTLVTEDTARYRQALEKTGGVFGGVEPVQRFHEAFQAPLGASHAAAAVGLETEVFLGKIREYTNLQNLGLLVLENGTVKRDTWTINFSEMVSALSSSEALGMPPIVSVPDFRPEDLVTIPDTNLRAAVAEALGKTPNSAITVAEMATLEELYANRMNISDLTGLEFATNLFVLYLNDNLMPDLSPLAGLTQLSGLRIARNKISDISPLAELKNLGALEIYDNEISDISPLAGLTNLGWLSMYNNPVSDLSPLINLKHLRGMRVSVKDPGDLSPIAELTNLEDLFYWGEGNPIPDLSPLTNLPKLRFIDIRGSGQPNLSPLARMDTLERFEFWGSGETIPDLSPLAESINLKELWIINCGVTDLTFLLNFTGIERLNLERNNISDVSPLAGLTNLKWLKLTDNPITDFSPLAALAQTTNILTGEVAIPDPNLRAAIAEALEKNNTAIVSITAEEMTTLTALRASNRGIKDLTGIEYAVNLEELWISKNPVSDLSALSRLVNLIGLGAWETPILDISPLAGLENLRWLDFGRTPTDGNRNLIGNLDLTPLAGITSLKKLTFYACGIKDISPLAGLTGLTHLAVGGNRTISDASPVARLINLEHLDFHHDSISDLSPLAGLTKLKSLNLYDNRLVSNLSPLAGLTNLTQLRLHRNMISDVSPLSGLINLEILILRDNLISDISALEVLPEHTHIDWLYNPGALVGGPKIEGPWLWLSIPRKRLDNNTDLLAETSDGFITENQIATKGAIEGAAVGDYKWTTHNISPTNKNNIVEMLDILDQPSVRYTAVYGSIILNSQKEQNTSIFVGTDGNHKIWLNGELIHEDLSYNGSDIVDYTNFFPVTLKRGPNILLVAIDNYPYPDRFQGYFGFEEGTEYTIIPPGAGFTFSATATSVIPGDTFTLHLNADYTTDLAGWQTDITFDPDVLEATEINEGDFLKTDGGATFFQEGTIDNTAGKIKTLSSALISESGVSGTGTLLSVTFIAKAGGETQITLENFEFGSITGDVIPAISPNITIIVGDYPPWDVNQDGRVSVLDLILVARDLGSDAPANLRTDVNRDGVINIQDLIVVAQHLGESTDAAAPSIIAAINNGELTPTMIQTWIEQAQVEDDGSLAFRQGIANLERLLTLFIPEKTVLLHNYPNPFNPETWIPYQLAKPAEVTLTIHAINGTLVRTLTLGYQPAGIYQTRTRAAYWDGKNQLGEPVASGVYFYTLTAGDFNATRKMLIRK